MKSSLYKILATEQTERVCETPLVKDSGGSARDNRWLPAPCATINGESRDEIV